MPKEYTGNVYFKFFKKLSKKDSGCWEWNGYKDRDGYRMWCNNWLKEQRASFKLFLGDIPNSLLVRHTCHNPSCCNPEHLKLGTAQDNATDCVKAGRSLSGFKNVRCKLNKEELIYILDQKGKEPATKLAKKVSIKSSQIYNIWNGAHKYEI